MGYLSDRLSQASLLLGNNSSGSLTFNWPDRVFKGLGAVAIAATLATPALAADMPMPVKAPEAPIVWSWTEFYFGVKFIEQERVGPGAGLKFSALNNHLFGRVLLIGGSGLLGFVIEGIYGTALSLSVPDAVQDRSLAGSRSERATNRK